MLSFGVLASAIISLIGAFPFIFVIIVLFLAAVGIPFYLILAGWMYLFSSFLTLFHLMITPTDPFAYFSFLAASNTWSGILGTAPSLFLESLGWLWDRRERTLFSLSCYISSLQPIFGILSTVCLKEILSYALK